MPTITGPKLVALGRIILGARDTEAIRIVDQIWKNRCPAAESNVGLPRVADQWCYEVSLAGNEAEYVFRLLLEVADEAKTSDQERARAATEMAAFWKGLCDL